MILERVAIDFRCRECCNIRRVDAPTLTESVLSYLPRGWVLEILGVSCERCAGASAEHVDRAKLRADAKREVVRKLRMPTAEVSTLTSPVTEAISPLVSDTCTRCSEPIGETQSWRPDPGSAAFAKAHRSCLIAAVQGEQS